jgi:catechol 2,3-dioxygenase-like lactoylglutathione lyase family enzyme
METVSVRYIVDDVDAAVDFYETRLGFAVEMHLAPGFAMLSRGSLRLLLNAPGAGGGGATGPAGQPAPGGWNRFQVPVDDLDDVVAGLEAAGVGLRTEVTEGKGGRQAVVDDPSGNPVEVFESTRA